MVQAATLVAPRSIEVRDYPVPDRLEPGAVLLRMIASGICGTDKHTYRGETVQYAGTAMERRTPFPIIQGHENIGLVEALGDGDVRAYDGTALRVGDRVVPAPNVACGQCRSCRRGVPYYLCRNLQNYGNSMTSAEAPHLFGGWSELLYLKPGTAVFRVPEELPSDVAVLTEIFAVTHSLERVAAGVRPGGFRPGDTVAVVGVGSLGMAHLVKAALMGAGKVVAVDRSRKRLDLARRLVDADVVLVPEAEVGGEGGDADGAQGQRGAGTREVLDLTEGEGADVVVDATGFPGSFRSALAMVRDAGTIVEVGAFVDMGPEAFNPAVVCGRNLTITGIGGEDLAAYPGTLALMARHGADVPFAAMISHAFPVADAADAVVTSLDPATATKVVISDEITRGEERSNGGPDQGPPDRSGPARPPRS